jgi:hypothetical protein
MKNVASKKLEKRCPPAELGILAGMILSGIDSLDDDADSLMGMGSISEDDIPKSQSRNVTVIRRRLATLNPESRNASADDLLVLCPALVTLLERGAVAGITSKQAPALVRALNGLISDLCLDGSAVSKEAKQGAKNALSCIKPKPRD